MLKSLFLVAAGGALGSVLRFLTGYTVGKYTVMAFPVSTFVVNIAGSLLIGIIFGVLQKYTITSTEVKFFLVVGFLGGFTTFSTFSYDNLQLLESGHIYTALLYAIGSVMAGLIAVWLGFLLARTFG